MSRNIIITGASSGFGALTARQLADDGHTLYAGMRDITGADKAAASATAGYARAHGVALVPVSMDVTSQEMVDAVIQRVTGIANGTRFWPKGPPKSAFGIALLALFVITESAFCDCRRDRGKGSTLIPAAAIAVTPHS